MTHAQLVEKAVHWLRRYRCGVVLSEQACISGEMPDAIGWKRACHSVLVECKVTRADFLADRAKPFRLNPPAPTPPATTPPMESDANASISFPVDSCAAKNSPRVGDCSNIAVAESKR